MKKQMFALIAMVSTLVGTGAQGSEWNGADCGGNFYVGGFAGANWLQDSGLKTGFAGGVSLGYEFQSNLRLEGEFSYRNNPSKKFAFYNQDDKLDHLKLNVETYAVMANLLYDFNLCSNWTPYVGFGVGYAWNKADLSSQDASVGIHKNDFAFQGIAGIAYSICEKTKLGLEYRYFQTNSHMKDHAVAISLRRSF